MLRTVWLAHTTDRSISELVHIIAGLHAEMLKQNVLGAAPVHDHHCLGSVRIYGWPHLSVAPAAGGSLRYNVRLTLKTWDELRRQARLSQRTLGGQLSTVIADYLRTLQATVRRPSPAGLEPLVPNESVRRSS